MSQPIRWHLVQHGFWTLGSHFFNEARCWHEAMEGRDWVGYASVHLPATVSQALNLLPAFTLGPDARLDPDPLSGEIGDYLAISEAFASECATHLGPHLSGDDVVVVTYSGPGELRGAALWLATLEEDRRPRMAFVFHRPEFHWKISADRTSVNGHFGIWRHGASQLAAMLPTGRRLLGATTRPLARCLSGVLAQPVEAVPLVLPAPLAAPARSREKRHDIVLTGEPRWEKGGQRFESLLSGLDRIRPGLRLSVQVPSQAEAGKLADALGTQGFSGQLDIVTGFGSVEEHLRRIDRARLVLLPYDQHRYALRASGIARECFMHGVPVVAPSGTSIADQIRGGVGAGVLFDSPEVPAIVAAVAQALDQVDALTDAAMRATARWQNAGGAAPLLAKIEASLGLH
jgi:hypothetical protein